jgi:hypothetical protein
MLGKVYLPVGQPDSGEFRASAIQKQHDLNQIRLGYTS